MVEHGGHEVHLESVSGKGMDERHARGWPIIEGQRLDRFEALPYWRRYTSQSKLVYELDDDVFSVETVNWQAHGVYSRPEVQEAVKAYAAAANLVTVSTPKLAEVMQDYSGNILVLHNYIPGYVCDMPDVQNEKPIVGWVGGASHTLDFQEVAPQIRRFLNRFPEWTMEFQGTDYRPALKHEHARYDKWVDITKDEKNFYESIDFDIGLAPLSIGSHFNHSKSHIKALEYAARGIPVIATDMAPYSDFVVHGKTGFLVRRDHEWLKYLGELASDEGLRKEMGANAREVAREWTMEKGWKLWEQAYKNLNARDE
jgi:hypothetical protein